MATKDLTISQELDEVTLSVIGERNLIGFEKAYLIANATEKLQTLLTPEYMKPIMRLQGSRLGFKSDKKYPEPVVKDCLIEAVLMGLQPHGNQFNIIAGNMYPTKEGLGYLLSNYPGLSYKIIPELPRINSTNTSAAIVMRISWSVNGSAKQESSIEIPVKMNAYMGTDAVIGKATRKARAWLYSTITGSEISEGDVSDLDSPININKTITINPEELAKNKEDNRVKEHIEKSEDLKTLAQVKDAIANNKELTALYANKAKELTKV